VSQLKIVHWPDPILLKPTKAVKRVDSSIEQLVDIMAKTMYAAPGVGLAANQIGQDLKLALIDVSPMEEEKDLYVLINPEIVHKEGKAVMEEGCLSLPGFKTNVTRALRVVVRALDIDMKPIEIEGEDLMARALQHEIDHLNGKLFRIKRELLMRKVRKAIELGQYGKKPESHE
jgi:peptide deformylase